MRTIRLSAAEQVAIDLGLCHAARQARTDMAALHPGVWEDANVIAHPLRRRSMQGRLLASMAFVARWVQYVDDARNGRGGPLRIEAVGTDGSADWTFPEDEWRDLNTLATLALAAAEEWLAKAERHPSPNLTGEMAAKLKDASSCLFEKAYGVRPVIPGNAAPMP